MIYVHYFSPLTHFAFFASSNWSGLKIVILRWKLDMIVTTILNGSTSNYTEIFYDKTQYLSICIDD